jgi:hypothetical protein
MLLKIINLVLLLIMLSGCATVNCKRVELDLPEMPIAGEKVANELELLCNDKNCFHLNNWLNELYLFKAQYEVYRTM